MPPPPPFQPPCRERPPVLTGHIIIIHVLKLHVTPRIEGQVKLMLWMRHVQSDLCRQLAYWSLRFSWSSACRSNYVFILDFTPGFNELGKDNCKTRRETFKFWDLVRLILEVWRYHEAKEDLPPALKSNHCLAIHSTFGGRPPVLRDHIVCWSLYAGFTVLK